MGRIGVLFWVSLFFLVTSHASAEGVNDCGIYLATGKYFAKKSVSVLSVFHNSPNQIDFKITKRRKGVFVPRINRGIMTLVLKVDSFDGSFGEQKAEVIGFDSVKNIRSKQELVLKKKMKCEKEGSSK